MSDPFDMGSAYDLADDAIDDGDEVPDTGWTIQDLRTGEVIQCETQREAIASACVRVSSMSSGDVAVLRNGWAAWVAYRSSTGSVAVDRSA
jgi:hypothetical protein